MVKECVAATPLRFAMSAQKTPKRRVDNTQGDSDMAELIGKADAALSSTPGQNPMDVSTYLVREEQYAQTDRKITPASLDSHDVPFDEESREVSALLDYLNDLSIDSSPLFRSVDSPNRAPDPSGALASACDITTGTPSRAALSMHTHTPARRMTLCDRLAQTSSSGIKPTFKVCKLLERATPRQTKALGVESKDSRAFSTPQTASTVQSSQGEETKCDNLDHGYELELDHSLEELLEISVDAMLSPRKQTWELSEEEWQRLEEVQRMSEMVLREAEYERESARTWARSMQVSVEKWVLEQQALEEARVRAGKDEVKAMRDALNRLQRDTKEAASHHEIVKRKLEAVIQQQTDKIRNLEEKLEVVEKNASVFKTPDEAIACHTSRKSQRTSRISPSPTGGKTHDEWRSVTQSPVTVMDPITPTKDSALSNSVEFRESISFTPRSQRARTSFVDGGKLVFYCNGTEKETRPDGTCIIRFPNGDVKCTSASESTVAYYHAKERVRP
jgi:hypothetical protein